MRKIILVPLFVILPIILISSYYMYNEADSAWSIQCSFFRFTKLYCPGCGGQRAFHGLLHGNIMSSFHNNALFVVLIPFFIYLYYVLFQQYGLSKQIILNNFFFSRKFGIIVLIVSLAFVILRNIPYYPFNLLAPLP